MKKKKIFCAAVISVIILLCFAYPSCDRQNKPMRTKLTQVKQIEVYQFSGISKFSAKYVDTITDSSKIEQFKDIFNELDSSETIKRIDVKPSLENHTYSVCVDIRPVFLEPSEAGEENGSYLLHLLIGSPNGMSYLIFAGTDLWYALEDQYTDTLLELFAA